jgi:hypothetical protein
MPDSVARRGWSWTLAAALAGFAGAFVGSSVLHLPRATFVAVQVVVAMVCLGAYATFTGVHLGRQVAMRWKAGLVVGLIFGVLLAVQVQSQPQSARSSGAALAADLAWFGVAYGAADALLLSVLPVLALYGARAASELRGQEDRLRWAGMALLGSAVVTAAYHLGFAEFRGAAIVAPVIGNLAITLSYLLSGSSVAPLVAHVIMHVAAVLHGMETTMQLPPHG